MVTALSRATLALSLHSLCALTLVAAHAQSSTITSTSTLVVVPALVQSTNGSIAQTLTASDFLLTDNGTPQRLTLDDTEHQPLSIVVVLQVGGAAIREYPDYTGLGTMLSYIVAGHPFRIAMVTFDSQPEDQWDFTSNLEDLADGFKTPGPGDQGAAILDAVNHGIDLLQPEPPTSRRLLLLISQTHDDGSRIPPADIIRRLGESNITLESLTFSPEKAWLKDQFTQPRHESPPYQLSPDLPLVLHTIDLGTPLLKALSAMRTDTSATIAQLSGGEHLPFATRPELEQQLSLLANHLAATYTLSFTPTSKEDGPHTLKLTLPSQPGLQVSARTLYWRTPATH